MLGVLSCVTLRKCFAALGLESLDCALQRRNVRMSMAHCFFALARRRMRRIADTACKLLSVCSLLRIFIIRSSYNIIFFCFCAAAAISVVCEK